MSLDRKDAGEKFWANTELVEKALLPYLDAESTKTLAGVHDLTLKILGKSYAWDKLIKRAFLLDVEPGFERDRLSAAGFLAEIIRMAKLSRQDIDWREMEMELLHAICRSCATSDEHSVICVNCSCLEIHHVSFLGFLILETVEAKLETAEQNVLKVVSHSLLLESVLYALSARVLRQDERVEQFVFARMDCNNRNSAKSWAVLVNQTNTILDPECDCTGAYKWWMTWQVFVTVIGQLGAEGWAAVRSVVERISSAGVTNIFVDSGKTEMGQGSREDMEAIWKVISLWTVHCDEISTQFDRRGKSEQESQEVLRQILLFAAST